MPKTKKGRLIDRVFRESLRILALRGPMNQNSLIVEVSRRLGADWASVSPAVRRVLRRNPHLFKVWWEGRRKMCDLTEFGLTVAQMFMSLHEYSKAYVRRERGPGAAIYRALAESKELAEAVESEIKRKGLEWIGEALYLAPLMRLTREPAAKVTQAMLGARTLLLVSRILAKRPDLLRELSPSTRQALAELYEEWSGTLAEAAETLWEHARKLRENSLQGEPGAC